MPAETLGSSDSRAAPRCRTCSAVQKTASPQCCITEPEQEHRALTWSMVGRAEGDTVSMSRMRALTPSGRALGMR